MFMTLAYKSLLDRKGSVLLSLLAMSVSVVVLLGIEHIRHNAKDNFTHTVSGTDLIVGARTGDINLLLYSVFRIGSPTHNISWDAYQTLSNHPKVKWTIPLSLGDSHKGYRVLGTTPEYFEHFKYGNQHALSFAQGKPFEQTLDAVLGSEVARKLGYPLGHSLILAHGIAATSFQNHDKQPFTVVGILAPTGTPVDHTVHVSLHGIEAIHRDVNDHTTDYTPRSITAFMMGLTSKIAIFNVQRAIDQYPKEPLRALLPGVTLSELWRMLSMVENTLLLISILVFLAACLGMSAMLLTTLRERTHEIQLLRAIGAPPHYLFLLIQLEALLITVLSCVVGTAVLTLALSVSKEYLSAHFGVYMSVNVFNTHTLYLLGALLAASLVIAIIPSLSGYRRANGVGNKN